MSYLVENRGKRDHFIYDANVPIGYLIIDHRLLKKDEEEKTHDLTYSVWPDERSIGYGMKILLRNLCDSGSGVNGFEYTVEVRDFTGDSKDSKIKKSFEELKKDFGYLTYKKMEDPREKRPCAIVVKICYTEKIGKEIDNKIKDVVETAKKVEGFISENLTRRLYDMEIIKVPKKTHGMEK